MSAQQKPTADVGLVPAVSAVQVTSPAVSFAPTLESSALGLRVAPLTAPTTTSIAPLPAQGAQSANVALMIVGGAMMIVGSVVDGDTGTIIMVGGGAIGLIGLFRYLR
jgi:hypothetical protein